MATKKPEPPTDETALVRVTEPSIATDSQPATEPAPRARVKAYDKTTGKKLLYPVPPSHLDGRFPNLSPRFVKEGK